MGGAFFDIGVSIVVDASGFIYTTGYFYSTADFDPGAGTTNLSSAGDADIFVSKLDASGNYVWAKSMGGISGDVGYSIDMDALGNVYISGYFQGAADFDPGNGTANLTSAGFEDIFVSKLDNSGNLIWAKRIGGTSSDLGESIAVDAAGNAYITGYFKETADFDPGIGTADLTSAGTEDIFVSKLDASGNFVWVKRMGSSSSDVGFSIAIDASSNVYTTGYFGETVDFDPGIGTANLTSAGSEDIFVSALSQTGALPVVLVQFMAIKRNSSIQLIWQTASEQNTSSFVVERSSDSRVFIALGSVAAANNSSSSKNYSFNDAQPTTGANFYRLKMIDADGKFNYSKIVLVNMSAADKALQVFPNPARDVLQVQASGNEIATMQLIDAAGRVMKQQKVQLSGSASFSFDVQTLPQGKYYLILHLKAGKQIQEFVKQ
jgi:hypothetical protein